MSNMFQQAQGRTAFSTAIVMFIAFAFAFFVLTLRLATTWGDVTSHLSAAESLVTFGDFRAAQHTATLWPPAMPVYLAVLLHTGADLISVGRIVNAVLFTVSAMLMIDLARTYIPSRRWRVAAVVTYCLCAPTAASFVTIQSESAFLVLLLLFLRDIQSPSRWRQIALIAAAACLLRYLGLTFVVTYTLVLAFRIQWWKLFAMWVISLAPLSLWLLHNLLFDGTIIGPRIVPERGVALEFLVRLQLHGEAVVISLGLLLLFRVGLGRYVHERIAEHVAPVWPVLLFVAVYTIVFFIGVSGMHMGDFSAARLIAPVVPPLLLAAGALVTQTNTPIPVERG